MEGGIKDYGVKYKVKIVPREKIKCVSMGENNGLR